MKLKLLDWRIESGKSCHTAVVRILKGKKVIICREKGKADIETAIRIINKVCGLSGKVGTVNLDRNPNGEWFALIWFSFNGGHGRYNCGEARGSTSFEVILLSCLKAAQTHFSSKNNKTP